MTEWTGDLQDIMDAFDVKKIPSLVVVNREGRSVVDEALDKVWDLMQDKRAGRSQELGVAKAAVDAKWQEWRRLAGDWRVSQGHTLGGGSASNSGAAAPSSAPGPESSDAAAAAVVASGMAGAGTVAAQRSNREALRAARLAALERRFGSGADIGAESSSSSSAAAAAVAPPQALSSSSSAQHAAPSSAAAPPPTAFGGGGGGLRIATIGSTVAAGAGSSGSGAASGSGTFAAGGVGAAGLGGVAYTLAGGRVELPTPPAPQKRPQSGDSSDAIFDDDDDEMFSDMASDGERSRHDEADLPEPDLGEAVAQIAAMGFPEDAARRALQASNGDVDAAVALLLGE